MVMDSGFRNTLINELIVVTVKTFSNSDQKQHIRNINNIKVMLIVFLDFYEMVHHKAINITKEYYLKVLSRLRNIYRTKDGPVYSWKLALYASLLYIISFLELIQKFLCTSSSLFS